VPANDARSVAVPIVPKRIGEIEVEVSSILQMKIDNSYMNIAGDAVKRRIFVVVGLNKDLIKRLKIKVIQSLSNYNLERLLLLLLNA